MILKGTMSASFLTIGSSKDLPISLLIAKNVFSGFVTPCLFAGCPTNFSSSLPKLIIEGVVLDPSAFSITLGSFPSIIEIQLFVVPKSIPITFAIFLL